MRLRQALQRWPPEPVNLEALWSSSVFIKDAARDLAGVQLPHGRNSPLWRELLVFYLQLGVNLDSNTHYCWFFVVPVQCGCPDNSHHLLLGRSEAVHYLLSYPWILSKCFNMLARLNDYLSSNCSKAGMGNAKFRQYLLLDVSSDAHPGPRLTGTVWLQAAHAVGVWRLQSVTN